MCVCVCARECTHPCMRAYIQQNVETDTFRAHRPREISRSSATELDVGADSDASGADCQ